MKPEPPEMSLFTLRFLHLGQITVGLADMV